MTQAWQEEYEKLTQFISGNPEIKIGSSVIRIPQDFRPEFQRMFESVRTALIKETYNEFLNKAELLRDNYVKIEEEVTRTLRLEKISLAGSLQLFLHDPLKQLISVLYNPLFDLLKGKINLKEFQENAAKSIEVAFAPLYRSGYDKWITLNLVKLLQANSLLRIDNDDATDEEIWSDAVAIRRPVPAPKQSNTLSFERPVDVRFIIPDLIIQSAMTRGYISFRSEINRALTTATDVSDEIEWLTRKAVGELDSNINLVYASTNPESLCLVSDHFNIGRPELIIQSIALLETYSKERIEKTKLCHQQLKPRLGTFVVLNEEAPAQLYAEFNQQKAIVNKVDEQNKQKTEHDSSIHLLNTGLDESKLEPILQVLNPIKKKEELNPTTRYREGN